MSCFVHRGDRILPELLETHHVHPQAYGGPDVESNRIILCIACHTACHRAAQKLYANRAGEARDLVQRHLPNMPARQERLWKLIEQVVQARQQHTRSAEIPEAGLAAEHQSTVKMSLDIPDWLHHRLKTLSTGQGLYRYILLILENHCIVATQKPGAPAQELFGLPSEPNTTAPFPLLDLTKPTFR